MIRKKASALKHIILIIMFLLPAALFSVEKKRLSHYEKAVDLYNNREVWLGAVAEARLELKDNPGHVPSYLLIANIFLEIKEYVKAAENVLAALDKAPGNKEAQNLMSKTVLAWEQSKTLPEQRISFYIEIARVYSRHKFYAKAMEYYQKYLQLKPQDLKTRLEYARVLSWAKYYSQAIPEYRAYLKKYPQEKKVSMELAYLYYWKLDLLSAETELTKILAQDPANIEATLLLGNICEQQSKTKKAAVMYEKVLQLSKNNKPAKEGLERIKKLEAEADEWNTVPGMKKIIEKTNNYLLALTLAHQIYYSEDKDADKTEAFKYYLLYLEKFPEDYETKLRVAEIFSWEKNYTAATELYQSYLSKYPEDNEVRLQMTKLLIWQKAYGPAIKELEIVQANDPSLADIYLFRGNIYEEQGDSKKALENYKQVVSMPYNQYNQEAIERILDIEKAFGIENRAAPELYMRYANSYENTYDFHMNYLDLGGSIRLNGGALMLNAGFRQYWLEQAGIASAPGKEIYTAAEGNIQENWKWSAALSVLQLYTYAERYSLTLGTDVQVSPDTLFQAKFYFNKDGILETGNLNTIIPPVPPVLALTAPLSVDDFEFQLDHKISEADELNAYFSESYFSDSNNREKFNAGYLRKIADIPVVKIGAEYEYLYFTQASTYYWTPETPYSAVSLVATLDNYSDASFFYRMKVMITRVIEPSQTDFSLEGEATYYLNKNISVEISLNFSRGTSGAATSNLTNLLLGMTYHFEK